MSMLIRLLCLCLTDRASYQAREAVEGDEERLAMRQSDMPPPVPERVTNPEFEKSEQCRNSKGTRKRRTVPHPKTPTQDHGLITAEASFHFSVRKAGPNVDLYNVSTYQCSIPFNNMGSFSRRSEFRKAEKHGQTGFTTGEVQTFRPAALSYRQSENSKEITILTAEADSIPTDEKALLVANGLVGCHSSRSNDLSIHARIDSQDMIAFHGNQMMNEMDTLQSLGSSLEKKT